MRDVSALPQLSTKEAGEGPTIATRLIDGAGPSSLGN
jgi:hypothetical protein